MQPLTRRARIPIEVECIEVDSFNSPRLTLLAPLFSQV